MKKPLLFLCCIILLIPLCISCAQFSRQPLFTDISGRNVRPLKLIQKTIRDNNTVLLLFSDEAVFTRADFFFPQTGKTVPGHVALDLTEDGTTADDANQLAEDQQKGSAFVISTPEPIAIGEPFILKGTVSDTAHTSLDFSLPFQGVNTQPAKLRITEVRPLYSSKPKSEFIELRVLERGNLAGITLVNVGDKHTPDYSFPAAEVEKNELIVYHFRSVEDNIRDEVRKDIISGGTQACPAARDFWGNYLTLPRKNANAILVKTSPSGAVQDAVLYCTQKEYETKGTQTWQQKHISHAVKEAVASGAWQGKGLVSEAVINALTASKSLKRKTEKQNNNAGSWELCEKKEVTMGF